MAETSEKAAEKATDSGTSRRPSSHGSTTDSTELNTTVARDKTAEQKDLEKADSKVVQPPKEATDNDPFKHLPPDEAEVLRRQVFTPEVKAGVAALYRYSSTNDIIITVVSALAAIASGALLPLMTVIFGNLQGEQQKATPLLPLTGICRVLIHAPHRDLPELLPGHHNL